MVSEKLRKYNKKWAEANPEKRRASRRVYEERVRKPARIKAREEKEAGKYF